MNSGTGNSIHKIVVLGHTGFIGKHLWGHFRSICPNFQVIGKSSRDVDLTSEAEVKQLGNIFDLNTIVIMLSANKKQAGAGIHDFLQNMEMTLHLCELMKKHPPKRFVFFSSQAVYGEDTHNADITEETPVNPTSYYGMAKFISERLFWKTLQMKKESSLLILRMPRIYGPGDDSSNYGPTMFADIAVKDGIITIWGNGTEYREFIYIDDLVDIASRLAFSSFEGILNVASGTSYSFREVLRSIEKICERKLKVKYRRRTKPQIDQMFRNGALLERVNDVSFTQLNKGLSKLYDYLMNMARNTDES